MACSGLTGGEQNSQSTSFIEPGFSLPGRARFSRGAPAPSQGARHGAQGGHALRFPAGAGAVPGYGLRRQMPPSLWHWSASSPGMPPCGAPIPSAPASPFAQPQAEATTRMRRREGVRPTLMAGHDSARVHPPAPRSHSRGWGLAVLSSRSAGVWGGGIKQNPTIFKSWIRRG